MATISKFYLLDATSPNTGTMPGAGNSMLNNSVTGDAAGARTARDATDVAGTSNPDIESSITSNANIGGQSWGHRRFVSRPLAARTFAAADGNWTISYARSQSNTNHNQKIVCEIYPWRPTTGLKIGTAVLFIGGTVFTGTTEATETLTVAWSGTQAILDGDILVMDFTTQFTQSMSTSYTDQFAYNGTTEASITTCASFVTPPAALTLYTAVAQVPYTNPMPPLIAQ